MGMVVESLRRVEDALSRGFDNVNSQLSKLPEQYVARREFDRYRDETGLDLVTAQQKHDKDIEDIRADARDRAAQARSLRLWLIGIGATSTIGLSGLVIQVATSR